MTSRMTVLPSLDVLAGFTAASLVLIFTPGPDMTQSAKRQHNGSGEGAGFPGRGEGPAHHHPSAVADCQRSAQGTSAGGTIEGCHGRPRDGLQYARRAKMLRTAIARDWIF
jgi:hypothetical protein